MIPSIELLEKARNAKVMKSRCLKFMQPTDLIKKQKPNDILAIFDRCLDVSSAELTDAELEIICGGSEYKNKLAEFYSSVTDALVEPVEVKPKKVKAVCFKEKKGEKNSEEIVETLEEILVTKPLEFSDDGQLVPPVPHKKSRKSKSKPKSFVDS